MRWLHRSPWTALLSELPRGLRTAAVTVVPLFLAWRWHEPALVWASLGGWLSALADPGGARGLRALVLLAFALLAGGLLALGLALAPSPLLTALLLVVVTFAGSLLRALGSTFASVGTLLTVVCAIATADAQRADTSGAMAAAHFIVGALLMTLLTSVVWPVWTHLPLRRALAEVFVQLARYADALAAPGSPNARRYHRPIREALEQAREVSLALRAKREGESVLGSNLRALFGGAETSFFALVTLAESELPAPMRRAAAIELARCYRQIAEHLRRSSLRPAPLVLPPFSVFEGGLLARLQDTATAAAQLAADPTQIGSVPLPRGLRLFEPHPLREQARAKLTTALSLRSPHLQHALRVTATIAVAFVVGRWLSPAHVAWVTVTSLAILQPQPGATLRRAGERALGTVFGCLATAAIMLAVHDPLPLALVMFVCATAAVVAKPHSYPLFTLFLTPVFVLFLDAGHGNLAMALERTVDSVIGAALALIASLWIAPAWEKSKLGPALAAAVEAMQRYADRSFVALTQPRTETIARQLDAHRVEFGLASNEAEGSLERMLAEPHPDKRGLHDAMQLLTYLRRLGSALTALDMNRELLEPAEHPSDTTELRAHVDEILTMTAARYRQPQGAALDAAVEIAPVLERSHDPLLARIERHINMIAALARPRARQASSPEERLTPAAVDDATTAR